MELCSQLSQLVLCPSLIDLKSIWDLHFRPTIYNVENISLRISLVTFVCHYCFLEFSQVVYEKRENNIVEKMILFVVAFLMCTVVILVLPEQFYGFF